MIFRIAKLHADGPFYFQVAVDHLHHLHLIIFFSPHYLIEETKEKEGRKKGGILGKCFPFLRRRN